MRIPKFIAAMFLVLGFLITATGSVRAGAIADVSAGEMAGMQLLYAVNDNAFDFADTYTADNSASIAAGSFSRVGYYVELGGKWVWASMDTFNADPTMVGVPKVGSGIVENGTLVNNLNIETNHANVTAGTGKNGIIEFWASNYNQNGGGLYGSDDGLFDWKDSGGSTVSNGHGSFQVFERPTATTGKTLFGITRNGGAGIGDQPTGHPDWTFGDGTDTYQTRNLEIWVLLPSLTWNSTVNDWGTANWLDSPPTSPDASTAATVAAGTVTVEADHTAYALTLTGGEVVVGPSNTLNIVGDLNASGTGAMTLGANSTLAVGDGSAIGITANDGATIQTSGSVAASHLALGTGDTFIKAGSGALTFNQRDDTNTLDGTNTVRVDAGVLRVEGGLTNPIGGADLILTDSTFIVQGNETFSYDQLDWARYDGGQDKNNLRNIDDQTPNTQDGGLFTMTPTSSGTWTGDVNDDSFGDYYAKMWWGNFHAPADGDYTFYTHGDDNEVLWVDLNQNGEFEPAAGERVTNNLDDGWNNPKTGTVTLKAGVVYPVAFAGMEGGGGESHKWQIDGAWVSPGSAAQDDWWSKSLYAAVDMTDTDVLVTSNSTVNAVTDSTADFGGLTLQDGILTTQGAPDGMSFAGTTVTGGGTVGFDTQTATTPGAIDGGGFGGPIVKTGSADLILDQGGTNLAGSTFDVQQGRLVALHGGTNPLGTATLKLNGGEALLSSQGGDVTYDNNVQVTADATLTAGQAPGGAVGPLNVTLGSPGTTVGIDAGKTLTLRSTDNYALDVAGQLAPGTGGEGNVNITEGNVALSGGGTVAKLKVFDATVSTPGVTVTDQFKVGDQQFTATSGSFSVSGNDLVSPTTTEHRTISLTGGEVSVSSGVEMPGGMQLWLDAGTLGLANGATVSTWADKSGLGHDMANPVSDPSYVASGPNGQPVVYFDGDDEMKTTYSFDPADEYSILSVSRYTSSGNSDGNSRRVIDSATRNWLFGYHGALDERFFAEGWIHNTGSDNTNWNLHAGTMTSDADPQASFWKQGALLTSGDTGSSNTNYKIGQLRLGGRTTENSKCEVAEVLIFDRVLTAEELDNIGGYLAGKYGLTTSYTGSVDPQVIDMPFTDFEANTDSTLLLDTIDGATLGDLSISNDANLELTGGAPSVSFANVTGTGSIETASEVIVRDRLEPGPATDSLTVVGDLTLADTSTFEWQLSSSGFDQQIVSGSDSVLTLEPGWTFEFQEWLGTQIVLPEDELLVFPMVDGAMLDTLIQPIWDTSQVDGNYRWLTGNSAWNPMLTYVAGEGIYLSGIYVVPEPSTVVIGLLGTLGLAWVARRRRRR